MGSEAAVSAFARPAAQSGNLQSCATVLESHVIDESAEWRSFADSVSVPRWLLHCPASQATSSLSSPAMQAGQSIHRHDARWRRWQCPHDRQPGHRHRRGCPGDHCWRQRPGIASSVHSIMHNLPSACARTLGKHGHSVQLRTMSAGQQQ